MLALFYLPKSSSTRQKIECCFSVILGGEKKPMFLSLFCLSIALAFMGMSKRRLHYLEQHTMVVTYVRYEGLEGK